MKPNNKTRGPEVNSSGPFTIMATQYTERKNELLSQLPKELAEFVESQAYDRGHHAGESEVDLIACNICSELVPAFKRLTERLMKEAVKA